MRLWFASVESSRDVPIGAGILTQISDSLRKIRNTARFMIGNLTGEGARVTTSDFQNLGLVSRATIFAQLWSLTSVRIDRAIRIARIMVTRHVGKGRL